MALVSRFSRAASVTNRLATRLPTCKYAIRTHMNHGGGQMAAPTSTQSDGPRQPLQLGLDAARATQNILRLLESFTHGVVYSDTLDTIWHSQGLIWSCKDDEHGEWKATSPTEQQNDDTTSQSTTKAPRLEWLNLSDDRTALAKIQGMDGLSSYVSMLRLDASPNDAPSAMVANDGWQIVRQVKESTTRIANNENKDMTAISSIADTLIDYLSVEHGGGEEDKQRAESLFAPQASLLAVGTAPLDEQPSAWSSPTGSYLEVPLETYLQGVTSQTPHSNGSKAHDAIAQIDVLPCQTAAAATVHVGNGAQTTVFVDHLLLGWYAREKQWKILSKVFTSRAWPVKHTSIE